MRSKRLPLLYALGIKKFPYNLPVALLRAALALFLASPIPSQASEELRPAYNEGEAGLIPETASLTDFVAPLIRFWPADSSFMEMHALGGFGGTSVLSASVYSALHPTFAASLTRLNSLPRSTLRIHHVETELRGLAAMATGINDKAGGKDDAADEKSIASGFDGSSRSAKNSSLDLAFLRPTGPRLRSTTVDYVLGIAQPASPLPNSGDLQPAFALRPVVRARLFDEENDALLDSMKGPEGLALYARKYHRGDRDQARNEVRARLNRNEFLSLGWE